MFTKTAYPYLYAALAALAGDNGLSATYYSAYVNATYGAATLSAANRGAATLSAATLLELAVNGEEGLSAALIAVYGAGALSTVLNGAFNNV